MSNGLDVISSRLFISEMSIDTCVSGSTGQVLTISERNVLTVGTLVALGETKINDVNGVLCLIGSSNQKVVRLDVTMDDSFFVDHLDSLDHLHGDVQNGLEVESPPALLEQIFERFAEHVHDHDVVHLTVLGFLVTNEVKIGYSRLSSKFVDELGLPEKHDMLLILYGFLNLSGQIVTSLLFLDLVNLTKGTTA